MAKSRQTFEKLQRERAKRERREEKARRKAQRKAMQEGDSRDEVERLDHRSGKASSTEVEKDGDCVEEDHAEEEARQALAEEWPATDSLRTMALTGIDPPLLS